MTLPEILTTTAQVADLAQQLAAQPAVAFDLEADSMHNYREKVCLLQVSIPDLTVLIDPLQVGDLESLRPVLANPQIRKIFHAGDYDLRCLSRDFGLEVRGLFDTMICAQLLGEEKIGLNDMLTKYFAVSLDKRFQRADWSQRPLPAEMINYAAEDTRHLHRLAALCEERLRQLGRLSWAEEEFALLEQVRFAEPSGPLCLRLKGAGTLDRRQLGVLEQLLLWRETEAERRDRPTYKVMGGHELLAIARVSPASRSALAAVEGLSPRLVERFTPALLAAVQRGLELPEQELPSFPRLPRRVKDPAADARLNQLKAWRKQQAAALRLDPGVLMNNALLEVLAQQRPQQEAELADIAGLKNWQRREFGAELLGLLNRNHG